MTWKIQAAQRWSRLMAKLHLALPLPRQAVALLDYDRHPIRIGVASEIEYHTRLHACKKEPEMIEWIERGFTKGAVFYDVGANVGTYTLVAAAYWGEDVRIVAIEPSAVNFSRLILNLNLNGCMRQVTPLPIALSNVTGVDTFHYENLAAGGSLHTLGEAADFAGKRFQPAASAAQLAFDLDTLIRQFKLPPPTHLKLDVDGIELKILEGAEETLTGVSSVFVELEEYRSVSGRIRAFLNERGFKEVAAHPYRYAKIHPRFQGVANVIFNRS